MELFRVRILPAGTPSAHPGATKLKAAPLVANSPEVVDQVNLGPSEVAAKPVETKPATAVPASSPVAEVRPMKFDSLRTARALGVLSKRMAPHLSPEALHELRTNVDLAGVLCGEMTIATLALEGKARDDIQALVKCLTLTAP